MEIFISWSGNRSKAVAELLKRWIKQVLQGTQPWVSTQDIDSGALWLSEISDKLKDSGAGIVCLTEVNKAAPWILFEAGGLAKGLTKNRVCTFLIDLKPADIGNPLGQFNHTEPNKESMWKLVQTFNQRLTGPSHLEESTLRSTFDVFWPIFEKDFAEVLKQHPPNEQARARTEESYLVEILENTRSLHQRIGALEARATADIELLKYFIGLPRQTTWQPVASGGLLGTSADFLRGSISLGGIAGLPPNVQSDEPPSPSDDKNKNKQK